MATKLILTRKREWFNRSKPFRVLINGKEYGLIKNDETVEYELDPGTYMLQLKHNWMSSPVHSVDLNDSMNSYVVVSNGMKYIVPLYIMMLVGLFLPFFLKIAKLQIPDAINLIKIILIVPALVYILSYLSIFKNKYIEVKKDTSNPFSK